MAWSRSATPLDKLPSQLNPRVSPQDDGVAVIADEILTSLGRADSDAGRDRRDPVCVAYRDLQGPLEYWKLPAPPPLVAGALSQQSYDHQIVYAPDCKDFGWFVAITIPERADTDRCRRFHCEQVCEAPGCRSVFRADHIDASPARQDYLVNVWTDFSNGTCSITFRFSVADGHLIEVLRDPEQLCGNVN